MTPRNGMAPTTAAFWTVLRDEVAEHMHVTYEWAPRMLDVERLPDHVMVRASLSCEDLRGQLIVNVISCLHAL